MQWLPTDNQVTNRIKQHRSDTPLMTNERPHHHLPFQVPEPNGLVETGTDQVLFRGMQGDTVNIRGMVSIGRGGEGWLEWEGEVVVGGTP